MQQVELHGIHRSYSRGCRCDECREGERQYRSHLRLITDFDAPEYNHGERRGYRMGCRCDACREANNAYDKSLTERRDLTAPDFPHGTSVGVRRGCRCNVCLDAKRKTERDRKRNRRASDSEYADRLRAQGRKNMSKPRAKKLHVAAVTKRNVLKRATIVDEALIKRIYLATPEGYTVDHIKPLARGGAHSPENLQYLPGAINTAKHARIDYDVSKHVIRWQDVLEEPSTTIPQGSRLQVQPKCLAPEMGMI